MTWVELHSESERLAIEAQLALNARAVSRATELYKRAAELEQKALDQLDVSKTRTRGITAVSAVALWFKAGDLIVDKVQTIQSMFYRTIEFVSGVSHRRVGRPTKELQEACRPWLFQSAPGSYQFSVAIQKPAQLDFFKQDIEPERIARHFLEIVSASSGDNAVELERLVPDENYRSTFLKLARNLSPTGKTFDRIEFRASGEAHPVTLSVESRGCINQQLRKKSTICSTADEVREELRGILRAVHLDKDWLYILVDGVPKQIFGLQEAVDDVIGPMVNRSVIVQAVRVAQNKLRFVDIELAE